MFLDLLVILFTRESLSRGVSVHGGLCPGGSLFRVSGQRGVYQRRAPPRTEIPHKVNNGWDASYWNAFLFDNFLPKNIKMKTLSQKMEACLLHPNLNLPMCTK